MISSIADNECILVHSNMPVFMQKTFLYKKKKRFMIHISCILTGEAVLICHSKVVISLRNNSLVKPALHSYLGKTDVIIYLESVLVLLIADGIKFCTTVYLSK